MAKGDANKNSIESDIDRVLRPVYLFAAADGFVSNTEIDLMVEFRATARGLFEARQAIELFLKTDDFEEAKKLFDGQDYFLLHDINDTIYSDLPEYLRDLHERRIDVDTDGVLALYEAEAKKVTDDFEREVVLLAISFVASRRGESKNEVEEEAFLKYTTENCWGLDPDRPDFISAAYSVLIGEKQSRDIDVLDDWLEDEELDIESFVHKVDTSNNENQLAQVFSFITVVLAADGENLQDQEKLELLGEITTQFWDFYEYDDPEDYGDEALGAINNTLTDIGFKEGQVPGSIVDIAQASMNAITDNALAESVYTTLCEYDAHIPLGENGKMILASLREKFELEE